MIILFFLLCAVYMVNYIDYIVFQMLNHPLVLRVSPLMIYLKNIYILVDFICQYFKIFAARFMREFDLQFFFLVLYLSGFGNKVTLTLLKELGSSTSFLILLMNLCEIVVNSSLNVWEDSLVKSSHLGVSFVQKLLIMIQYY